MASPDPELKDGLTLPLWMKTKPTKEFEPFASSPPAPEDSFFYIRYPKTEVLFGKPKFTSDVTTEKQHEFSAADFTHGKEKDWSKHTKPCQDVLHSFGPINTAVNSPNLKPKPAGVDDGFKGEGAACGSSVVKVANQMIQSKASPRGFTVAAPSDDELSESLRHKLSLRRNSKSLPATPAHSPPSSPTGRRKMIGNRFFTSPYEPVEELGSRSWLTAALLGFKKDLTSSTSTLAEEEYVENRLHSGSLVESVENLGPAPKMESLMSTESSQPKLNRPNKPSQTYRPKPSELREMNFWSPTSM